MRVHEVDCANTRCAMRDEPAQKMVEGHRKHETTRTDRAQGTMEEQRKHANTAWTSNTD